MLQQGVHAAADLRLGHGAVVEPYEGYVEGAIGGEDGQEEVLAEAVSLAARKN